MSVEGKAEKPGSRQSAESREQVPQMGSVSGRDPL